MPGDHRPLVEALRLENLLARQQRVVLRLAQQLEDAELVRQVLEREVHRVRHPLVAADESPEAPPERSAAATTGSPDSGSTAGAAACHWAPTAAGGTPAVQGSADGTDPGGAHAQAPVTPAEPAGSSQRHAYAPPGGDFRRGGSAWGKHAKDETGKRYGKLSVIERAPNDGRLARWRCGCDCGASCVVAGAYLRQGKVTSCPDCRVDGRKHQTCSICGDAAHRSPWCPQRPKDETAVAEGFKRCCQCRAVKPVADFYAHTASGGYQARCKLCDNKARVRRSPKRADCAACKSMPSRVEGPRCVDCGLEAERPPRATDFSGGDSALARAIG